MRVESDRPIDMGGAGTGYIHCAQSVSPYSRSAARPIKRLPKPRSTYPAAKVANARRADALRLKPWSLKLGVDASALVRIGAGLRSDGALLMPEWGEDDIIGIQVRNRRKINRGNRGLTLPDLSTMPGPLIVCEGAGDTVGREDHRRCRQRSEGRWPRARKGWCGQSRGPLREYDRP